MRQERKKEVWKRVKSTTYFDHHIITFAVCYHNFASVYPAKAQPNYKEPGRNKRRTERYFLYYISVAGDSQILQLLCACGSHTLKMYLG